MVTEDRRQLPSSRFVAKVFFLILPLKSLSPSEGSRIDSCVIPASVA